MPPIPVPNADPVAAVPFSDLIGRDSASVCEKAAGIEIGAADCQCHNGVVDARAHGGPRALTPFCDVLCGYPTRVGEKPTGVKSISAYDHRVDLRSSGTHGNRNPRAQG